MNLLNPHNKCGLTRYLDLSEKRNVSSSHLISSRANLGQFWAIQSTNWSTWILATTFGQQSSAIPITNTLKGASVKIEEGSPYISELRNHIHPEILEQFMVSAEEKAIQLVTVAHNEFGQSRLIQRVTCIQCQILQIVDRPSIHPRFQHLGYVWLEFI